MAIGLGNCDCLTTGDPGGPRLNMERADLILIHLKALRILHFIRKMGIMELTM